MQFSKEDVVQLSMYSDIVIGNMTYDYGSDLLWFMTMVHILQNVFLDLVFKNL